ncbi:DEKNAAC101789 [Brettanomyces naardenensis]|uniref:DnaJ homolog 1, mitochondrial n=1 Tax=Brettanomyces naardenensis TaxID=13370 RepID=A0A448YJ70_BRENA|nr:DEKNAAC101789 [Brettanomyces naardenensis]
MRPFRLLRCVIAPARQGHIVQLLDVRAVNAVGSPSFARSLRSFHSSSASLIEDPYKVLGIDKNSSPSQIKKAYYKLAKQYHPDVNKATDAEEKFHSLQEAYDILSDPKKKLQYDQFGAAGFGPSGAGGPAGSQGAAYGGNPFGGFGGARTGNPFEGFGINLDDLFGMGGRRGGGAGNPFGGSARSTIQHFQGEDIEMLKTISFKEAIFGTTVAVKYDALSKCGVCEGTGLKQGRKKTTCPTCNGTGSQVHFLQAGFQMASTCSTCGGTGVIIKHEDQCTSCHGEGVVNQRKETEVRLPQGIRDGSRIRVAGAGDAPHTTLSPTYILTNGDLIIRVRVKPDPDFTREGNNLIYKCKIPMTTACLGGKVDIPTLDGQKVKLRIPSGAEQGRIISIPDKGVPFGNGRRGDEKVVIELQAMKPETATQTALLEALAEAFGDTAANKVDPSWKMGAEEGDEGETKGEKKPLSALEKVQKFLSGSFKRIKEEKKH